MKGLQYCDINVIIKMNNFSNKNVKMQTKGREIKI